MARRVSRRPYGSSRFSWGEISRLKMYLSANSEVSNSLENQTASQRGSIKEEGVFACVGYRPVPISPYRATENAGCSAVWEMSKEAAALIRVLVSCPGSYSLEVGCSPANHSDPAYVTQTGFFVEMSFGNSVISPIPPT